MAPPTPWTGDVGPPEPPSQADLRGTLRFAAVEAYWRSLTRPGSGIPVDAVDPRASADGSTIACTVTVWDDNPARPRPTLFLAAIDGSSTVMPTPDQAITLPAWSPVEAVLACVNDARVQVLDAKGSFQAELGTLPGTVEQLCWSPDGRRLAALVAGADAHVAGNQGGTALAGTTHAPEPWMPLVDAGPTEAAYRTIWLLDRDGGAPRQVPPGGRTAWEVAWSGPDTLVAIASKDPTESGWYHADVVALDLAGGSAILYAPRQQVGSLGVSANGTVSVIEGLASDRGLVAGQVWRIRPDGDIRRLATPGLHVTCARWRNEDTLLVAGLYGFATIVANLHVSAGPIELWRSEELTCSPSLPTADPLGDDTFVMVSEAWDRPPTLSVGATPLQRFAHDATDEVVASIGGPLRHVTWKASDGWDVQGFLALPTKGTAPYPLVVEVHGGPVAPHRDRWLLRSESFPVLVSQGYAVLFPNPRGSSGRGAAFAEPVVGDMGGADADDILSGIDHLVAEGIADPARLGVTGRSYGGFMSALLATRDHRFAAVAPRAPVTNWYSQHGTSDIPDFDAIFVDDGPHGAGERRRSISPAFCAGQSRTPALIIAGALDQCTPPTQAQELHTRLRRAGVDSTLVVYPQDGHHIATHPAAYDHGARLLAWFQRLMPARAAHGSRA